MTLLPEPLIDRAFVRTEDGEMHMRRVAGEGGAVPLVLLHPSPGSSRGLIPLLKALKTQSLVPDLIAPDTPGQGDSAAPGAEAPEIDWFADALLRLLDRMGLEKIDLFGSHTGARIACEFAVRYPERIGRVIFDGIGDYEPEVRDLFLREYAPVMAPDDYGRQFMWAFQYVRDQALHFPHFMRDPAHRLMSRAVPSAEDLHGATLEVLKGLTSYHKPYLAAFRYAASQRLPDVAARALMLCPENELANLREKAQSLCGLLQDGRVMHIGPTPADKARAIAEFLGYDKT